MLLNVVFNALYCSEFLTSSFTNPIASIPLFWLINAFKLASAMLHALLADSFAFIIVCNSSLVAVFFVCLLMY